MWAFDWYRNRWPWMILNSVVALSLRHFAEFNRLGGRLRHSGWRQTYKIRCSISSSSYILVKTDLDSWASCQVWRRPTHMGGLIVHSYCHRFLVHHSGIGFISERELKFMFAICHRPSVCLSVVCNVRAPYSDDWNFRQCFYAIWYLGHPWLIGKNFTDIIPGEPIRRGS